MVLMVFLLTFATTTVNAVEVTKNNWIEAISTALPTAFCQSQQYFRQCFEVSQIECEETASSATRICLEKNKEKIPNILIQPKDGTHWGAIIGKCVGEPYEITLQKKRIDSKKCNDLSNWQ